MSQNPEKGTKDTKKVAENNIEQAEPVERQQDPTEPVSVEGGSEGKGKLAGASRGM